MLIRVSNTLRLFVKDRYIIAPAVAGIVLLAIMFGIAYVQLLPLGKDLILHFNFQGEVDTVGSAKDVVWLILTLILIFILNEALAFSLYLREKVMAYILSYTGSFILMMGLIIVYYLTTIN